MSSNLKAEREAERKVLIKLKEQIEERLAAIDLLSRPFPVSATFHIPFEAVAPSPKNGSRYTGLRGAIRTIIQANPHGIDKAKVLDALIASGFPASSEDASTPLSVRVSNELYRMVRKAKEAVKEGKKFKPVT